MHHLTRGMSPSIKSTTTEIFTLTDPIMPIDFERDPTNEWFNIHSKFSIEITVKIFW